jgi:hypothetical protein
MTLKAVLHKASMRLLQAVLVFAVALALGLVPPAARAQGAGPDEGAFSAAELVDSGHRLFGSVSRGLALTVQEAVKRWGEPNGYILGEEASGALIGGLRYGEGTLYTRNAGQRRVFWQGPSLGFDVGGDGARTMMLVYNLPAVEALYTRFVGLNGSVYLVGGFGLTAVATVLSGLAPLPLADEGSVGYRAASQTGVDADAVLGMRIGSRDRATRAHHPGLSPLPLPGMWQAVQ